MAGSPKTISNMKNFREDFYCDPANRLDSVVKAGITTLSMSYESTVSNRIASKSDAGTS
jgi:hypothetical protein